MIYDLYNSINYIMLTSKLLKFVYPSGRVNPLYGKYVTWSCLSNMITSMESVLSTHSMLSVSGNVSNELAFSVNYIGKDIIGQTGGIWFMSKMGSKIDKNSKTFITYSMGFQQVAILAECMTPILPVITFIPVAGISNIAKNISFTCFGAINTRVIKTLAEDDNIGEIYAKISILNTIGSSLGMGIGLIIAAYIPDHCMRLVLLPFLFTCRIYTYNKSIKNLI